MTTCYLKQIEISTNNLRYKTSKRRWITLFRIISFVGIIVSIYFAFSTHVIFWLCGVLCLIIFLILVVIDNRLLIRIETQRAIISIINQEQEYLSGNLSSLDSGQEYQNTQHPFTSDLDVFGPDSLFQHLNRTVTPLGKNILSNLLRFPLYEEQLILERQKAVQELSNVPDWILHFRALGIVFPNKKSDLSNIDQIKSLPPFLNRSVEKILLYILNAGTLLLGLFAILNIVSYSIFLIAFLVQWAVVLLNLKRINTIHRQIESTLRSLSNLYPLVTHCQTMPKDSSLLNELNEKLFGSKSTVKGFKELKQIVSEFDQRNNVFVSITLNGLYTRDLHLIIRLNRWIEEYLSSLSIWVRSIAEIDTLISQANFKLNHPEYTFPQINHEAIFQAREMGHPLMFKPCVKNDFDIKKMHEIHLITGANMAGKSTFLRSVGIHLVLALTGNVVRCQEMHFTPIRLFTAMRTSDNLAKGESYFHAELLRLKQLVTETETGTPHLIILDEMLKGTNSVDKLNGSRQFLIRLLQLPVCGIVATHDLALGELENAYPENFQNQCFEISHEGSEIIYDYKLKTGISRNMNASLLLKQMGLI